MPKNNKVEVSKQNQVIYALLAPPKQIYLINKFE